MSNQHNTRWEKSGRAGIRERSKTMTDAASGVNLQGISDEVDRKYRAWLRRRGLPEDETVNFTYSSRE